MTHKWDDIRPSNLPKIISWRWVVSREVHNGEQIFAVRELYTDEKGGLSWSSNPIALVENSFHELAQTHAKVLEAMFEPILDLTLDPPQLVDIKELK